VLQTTTSGCLCQAPIGDGNDPPTDQQNFTNLGNAGNADELIDLGASPLIALPVAACVVSQGCTATVVITSFISYSVAESLEPSQQPGPPPNNGHPLEDPPNGGYQGPEPAPGSSGPPSTDWSPPVYVP
jgi:hypothetical protein